MGPERLLGARHAIAVAIGMVIGAGIFRTSPLVAANVTSDAALFGAWILGGLLSLAGALCFAELAAAFPHAGGDYHFLRRAYGPRLAFLFAWSRFSVIHAGAIALLAFVCGDYLNEVVPLGPHGVGLFAAFAVVVMTGLNLRGIRTSTSTQLGLVGLVAAGLLIVGLAGVWLVLRNVPPLAPAAVSTGMPAFGVAMVFVFLAYGGWSDAATLSAEMRDDRRGIVVALSASLLIVTLLYLTVNWAFWRGLGLSGLAASQAPAATLMRHAFGPVGEWLIVVVVAITTITVMNSTMIVGARTIFACAGDVARLDFLSRWSSERGVPAQALLAQGGVALLLVALGTATRGGFATIVDYMSPVYWFFLILSGFALIRLRRQEPDAPRPFRVPFYPWLPLLFCASSAYVFYSTVAYVKVGAMVGVAILAVGALLLPLLDRRPAGAGQAA
jgi:amino acid transporter